MRERRAACQIFLGGHPLTVLHGSSYIRQRCPSLDFFLEPELSFFGFVFLGEPEPELFWFSFFGGARAFFVLSGARAGKAREARLELEPSFSFFVGLNVVVMVMV